MKKIIIGIIILLVILSLSFIIPINVKYKEIFHGKDTMASYTEYKRVFYNIYGVKVYEE